MKLYKNGKLIIYGLKRKTYLQTFELLRRKATGKVSFMGRGQDMFFSDGNDFYVVIS